MAKETKNIKEALNQFKNFQHVFLATVDDDQPRVRPVTLINFAGLAKIIKDRQIKAKLAKHCNFFRRHWKSVDDPNYALLQIIPSEITYVTPEETKRMKL